MNLLQSVGLRKCSSVQHRFTNSVQHSLRNKTDSVSCTSRTNRRRLICSAATKAPQKPQAGKGFGSNKSKKKKPETKRDGAARLKIAERAYDRMYGKENTRAYVVLVRKKGDETADWLPVAVLVLETKEESSKAVEQALPYCCREITECARLFSLGFADCLSHDLEYSYQLESAFMQRPIVEKFLDARSEALSKETSTECPYAILGITKDAEPSQVRSAYRSMVASYHPDRFEGQEKEEAEEKFKKVSVAYEQIKRETNTTLLGGTGTLSEDEAKVVTVETFIDEPPPPGLKIGVIRSDEEIAELFVVNRKYRRRISNYNYVYVPESAY